MRKRLFLLLLAFISLCQMYAVERTKLNFNGGWLLKVGDFQGAEQANYKDAGWKQITLPRAFNEKEAFKVSIEQLSDTIMWYRKHFKTRSISSSSKACASVPTSGSMVRKWDIPRMA